jgi:hypothetical protein
MQSVVHQRYGLHPSIVPSSSRMLQDCARRPGDATMATTILDRLTHRATMLEFEGKRHRLEQAAARIAAVPSRDP